MEVDIVPVEYSDISDQEIRDCQGFILVYDITNPSSLSKPALVYDDIVRVKRITTSKSHPDYNPIVPLILVGNKLDLEMERKITSGQGEEIASGLKCPYFETSATMGININGIFHHLAQIMANTEEMVRLRNVSGSGMSSGAVGEKVDGDDTAEAQCFINS
jgi:GTPase KRas